MALTLRLTRQLPNPKRILVWASCIVALVGVASMFQPTMIVGKSMEPTLHTGKMIWIDRAYYRTHKPKRGEVVVFKNLGQVYVKRVYRGPGERFYSLTTASRGFMPIREGREQEMARRFGHRLSGLRVREIEIPDDHVFVLGDNYFDSIDSREFGPIPVDSILGRALVPADKTVAMANEVVPPPADKARAQELTVTHLAQSH